jgi:ADP-ribose pyrophosphatase YjhB (NUDIX family)
MKSARTIEILARGVCVRGGRLLVCQSKGAPNTYLPGGHVEWRERAADGLAREIMEELGRRAVIGDFLGAVEHTFIQNGERHCEINLVFRMEVEGVDVRRAPESVEDWIGFKWISLTQLGGCRLEPYPLRTLIPAWLRARERVERWGSSL